MDRGVLAQQQYKLEPYGSKLNPKQIEEKLQVENYIQKQQHHHPAAQQLYTQQNSGPLGTPITIRNNYQLYTQTSSANKSHR